jgi:flagellar hook-associated protein 3 FlgL
MRVSDKQIFEQNIFQIISRRTELARLQEQVATGRRLLSPADDPSATAQLLGIRQSIQATQQFQKNANLAVGRLSLEETMLIGATDTLQRVRELVLQGKNSTLSEADRFIIASEVRVRLGEILDQANTRDANGEYLFAGFKGKTQPFTVNSAGQVVYNGDQGQRLLQISANQQVPDRDSGFDIFMAIRAGNGTFTTSANAANSGSALISAGSVIDPSVYQANDFRIVFTSATSFDVIDDTTATTILTAQPYADGSVISFNGVQIEISGQPAAGDEFNVNPSVNRSVFEVISNAIAALEGVQSNDAQATAFQQATDGVLVDIDQAMENILRVRTTIGGRLNVIDSQQLVNDDFILRLTEVRSSLEDADMVDVSIRLSETNAALQAAQQAYVLTSRLSLFNFI